MARRDIDASKDGDQSIAERIARATGIAEGPPAKAAAESAHAARHEGMLQVLRGLLPGGWHPKIVLEGRDHLDAILARGKGAVLWMAHFAFAGTVVKMGLHGAGYRLAHVSRPEHGFSKTRFGMAVLNPIRTLFENRHLTRRLVYRREQPAAAMLAIRDFLAENGVVTMTAGAWEGSRMIEAPFLGGIIRLAAGPVRIARESGAGLLPVFGVKTGRSDEFLVRVGEPIEIPPNAGADEGTKVAARGFLGALAPMVLKYPEQWRGWSALIDR
jgi:lauroyl/myristoyl acyltransferase